MSSSSFATPVIFIAGSSSVGAKAACCSDPPTEIVTPPPIFIVQSLFAILASNSVMSAVIPIVAEYVPSLFFVNFGAVSPLQSLNVPKITPFSRL